ncbi:ankyrin repeat domain-containing protein [Phaeosphaeria sp. MPI-PUGE-AT-0046c]|nr:ankyrin repeat domain-containing protein [Phaeosphaeria sp. MPI-PUGE-AT-0046c]
MDPLSLTASIIAILQFTTKLGEGLRDAQDASKDCSHFTAEMSNLSNLLVTLLSRIDEESQDPWNVQVQELGGRDGVIYQYRVALEQLKDKITIGHGVRKITKTLLWKYVKNDAEYLLTRIERLKSHVRIALEMDHFKLSQANNNLLASIDDHNKVIHANVALLQRNQDHTKHLLIMDWLSSADFPAQQLDHIQRRQEETGFWFLNAPEFTDWIKGSQQTLFCPGIPGAGKTMMAAIAVDHLQKAVQTPDIGVAYLYCSYKRQEQQTTSSLLEAMLKQLVQDNPLIAKPVYDLYDTHEVRKTRPSVTAIVDTLKLVLASFTRTYVVIDALDECSDKDTDRSKLLEFCFNLQQQTSLHLMATSRHISNIVSKFAGVPKLEVRADPADVKRFVKGQIGRLPKCIQRDVGLQERIQDRFAEVSDGMFLLARLHIDSLLDKRTKAKVVQTLENLAKGTKALERAYDEAIIRIDSQLPEDSTLAKNTLSWIFYARRPFTVNELCHALAVEIEDEELNVDNIPDIDDIVSVCAGLVTIDEEGQILRLVHYTTQEYFETTLENWVPGAQYSIAATCITYLCFKTFQTGPAMSDTELETRAEEHPLLEYFAEYWASHIANVQEETAELAGSLLQQGNLVACIIQARSLTSLKKYSSLRQIPNSSQDFTGKMTGLHLTASLGLLHLSEELLLEGKGGVEMSRSQNGDGNTPLSLAAQSGHERVVEMLLKIDDIDLDHANDILETPLMLAAFKRHERVVKMLLDTGKVDVNARDKWGCTALWGAAQFGSKETVELLLARKADVNTKGFENSTALIQAACGEDTKIVELLLASKADVHATDIKNHTALIKAASWGRAEIVKLLLDTGKANVNAKNTYGYTALTEAVRARNGEIIRTLLAVDNIEVVRDRALEYVLDEAALSGHTDIVNMVNSHLEKHTPTV